MSHNRLIPILMCALAPLCAMFSGELQSQGFTFIQVSDLHVPHADSISFIRSLKDIKPVYLAPYQVTSTAPEFAIATGDLTEFGGGAWQDYVAACNDTSLPWYHLAGNHDQTWFNVRPDIRKIHKAPYYSFDRHGCHFIVLDSATPQDPRPTFGREEIEWLKADLAKIVPDVPLFVFCHHPLGGTEFISSYEQSRVLDLLRPYNVVAFVAGHYHRPRLIEYQGFQVIVGGQGYGEPGGYNVFFIDGGYLWVAYRRVKDPEAATALLQKKIGGENRAPVQFPLVRAESTVGGTWLHLEYLIDAEVKSAELTIDDCLSFPMPSGECVELPSLLPGWHFGTMSADTADGKRFGSFRFEVAGDKLWECQLGGAFKTGPTLGPDRLYVGGADGKVYALDKFSGKTAWSFATRGEILGGILWDGERAIAASADGKVYAFNSDGRLLWQNDLGVPLYAPPVACGSNTVVCDREGRVIALAAADGGIVWQKRDAAYTVEAAPCVHGGDVYLGAWDSHLYRYRAEDGALMWKVRGAGSAVKPAPQYYSPADCPVVVVEDKLYAADRAYFLGRWDAPTGVLEQTWENVAAIAPAGDGRALYLRKTTGALSKVDLLGNELWSTPGVCDAVPTPPSEFKGRLYVCSAGGKFSAINAADGKLLRQYQVTPALRVFGKIAVDDSGVYVADMDGKVTALPPE